MTRASLSRIEFSMPIRRRFAVLRFGSFVNVLGDVSGMVGVLRGLAERIILLEGWRAAALAFAAGAVSALSMAPYHLVFVLFATVPVLIWLLDGAVPTVKDNGKVSLFGRVWPAFRTGWWFGFGYFLAGLWWIGQAFLVDGDEFAWLLPIAVLILPAGLALFWGLAASLARLAWTDGWSRLVALGSTLALAEWVRGFALTGFPWNSFGSALMPSPLFMQSAGLVGVYTMALFAIIVFGVLAPFGSPSKSGNAWGGLAVALALVFVHAGWGFYALSKAEEVADVTDVRLRLVQPAIAQNEKWDRANEAEIMARYFDLSNVNRGPEGASVAAFTHVIWPESAFPFILTDRRDQLTKIADLLPPATSLITGAMRLERGIAGAEENRVFNAMLVLNGDGEIVSAYDKTRLVPFGEFLPFQSLLEQAGFQQLTKRQGGFAKGTARNPLQAPGAPAFLPLICYEIIFSGSVLPATNGEDGRPSWIVNVTNDAWFGTTAGPYQHAHQAQIQAVETGLPVVRTANSGISMVVDGAGRVRNQLGLGLRGVVDSELPGALPVPIFSRLGNTPFMAFLGLLFLIVVGIRLQSTK
ncbi:MAG: apolipoprotein N-acyltransferase, partial [Pseudomonadota bacterium]